MLINPDCNHPQGLCIKSSLKTLIFRKLHVAQLKYMQFCQSLQQTDQKTMKLYYLPAQNKVQKIVHWFLTLDI